MENACRKCVELTVEGNEILIETLEAYGADYRIKAGGTVEIYGETALSELILKLAQKGCTVTSMKEHDESLSLSVADRR
ncbi:MAG: hypothetical protein ACLSA6_11520 [Holdemania massiliensis]